MLFWHDKRCEEQSLKFQFPNFFRMACLTDATVQKVLSWNRSLHYWDITFTRCPNDWGEESILNLLSLFADLDVNVHPEGEDKIVWSLDSRWIFSVKSLCEKILGSNRP